MDMLKNIFLIIFAILDSFVGVNFRSIPTTSTPSVQVVDSAFEDRTFSLVNEERVKAKLKPLARNVQLDKSAELKLQDMVDKGYFEHISPTGDSPWVFFDRAGYEYHFAGENLASDFSSPDSFVSGWMSSSKHKENIMDPKFTESGVAVVVWKGGRIYVVQHFASPLSD
jgi:uncharacterized protein YkwD